jgi:hypothetical protein
VARGVLTVSFWPLEMTLCCSPTLRQKESNSDGDGQSACDSDTYGTRDIRAPSLAMQKPKPLNDDWNQVRSALSTDRVSRSNDLMAAMLQVADSCASALRSRPYEPLSADEQRILDEELEDDPRFYEIMIYSETIDSTKYVLEWYDKTVATVNAFLNGEDSDYQKVADVSVQCWDYIVLEYQNHQLAHMAALIAAQIVSTQSIFHPRTWLFRISNSDRWALFLGLAQELKVLQQPQVRDLATQLAN